MDKVMIAPSILGVSKENLIKVINQLYEAKEDYIHFDVMDGKFVSNVSFSKEDLKFAKEFANKNVKYDVHLMTFDLKKNITDYALSGADIITFHYEACNEEEIKPLIDLIHSFKIKAGMSIKPGTDARALKPYLNDLDLVLVMSVEPGKGGQSFMEDMLSKVKYYSNYKKENNLDFIIEIDGGINKETAVLAKESGVNMLVSGSYILKSNDYASKVESLR